jgi:SAM-dependent methyltransferase
MVLQGLEGSTSVDRSAYHRALYDSVYAKRGLRAPPHFPRQFRYALAMIGRTAAPLRVLDLGGGSGEYSMAMQAMGHEVTLVDISEVAIERARALGVRNAICADFLAEVPEDRFDLVLCKGFSPLNTDRREEFCAVVRRVEALLRPGGAMLYWAFTSNTGTWSAPSRWFNWRVSELREMIGETVLFPSLRHQAMLGRAPWLNSAIGRAAEWIPGRRMTVLSVGREGSAA